MSILPPDWDGRVLTRREILALFGVASAAALTGSDAYAMSTAASLDCIATVEEEEGPYFVDEKMQRADIRPDPTTGIVSAGLPLTLRIGVARVDGASCAPLPNAMVDIWQCDAAGVYSDVKDIDGQFDSRGKKFLRGHQITDAKGMVSFTTVYPGWYHGRTPHIHFKVRHRDGAKTHAFTSQWYFDEAITDEVYRSAPYTSKGKRDTPNAKDDIYVKQHGAKLHLRLTKSARGYDAAFNVGMKLA